MYKVLIADDEIKVCQLIESLVEWAKLDLQLAAMVHNGLEAVKAVEELDPDIVIADIRMPELDGLALLRRIKEAKKDIYFLIISGYRNFEYVRDALQNEAEDYLLKPIRKAELHGALQKIIDKMNKKREFSKNVNCLRQGEFVRGILEHRTEEDYPNSPDWINEKFHCGFTGAQISVFAVKIDIWTDQNFSESISVLGRRACQIAWRELEKSGFISSVAAEKDMLLGIVDGRAACSEEFKNCLRHIVRDINGVSDKTMKVRAAAGVGGCGSFRDLYRLAAKSQRLVWDRLWIENADIILDEEVQQSSDGDFFSFGLQRDFRNAVECLNEEQAFKVIDAVLGNINREKYLWASGWKIYEAFEKMFFAVGNMIKKMMPPTELSEYFRGAVSRLRMCGSLLELCRYTKKTISYLFREVRKNKEFLQRKPVRDAKQYICDHFSEELTLEAVSARAGLNPAYFSTVFKAETGLTFTKYLTDIRIEKAKELLLNPELSVSEVAWSVGYKDDKYFMRVFKKTAGLTAAKYRKLYR